MTSSAQKSEQQIVKVTSEDGTSIACWVSGQGPPLVLVHGAFADHTRWEPVVPTLSNHFTVYSVDRRGRGASGDSPAYSIEREFDDITAVLDSIPAPVSLLGHSYGGISALEAALRTWNIKKLIIFEPPVYKEGERLPPQLVGKINALVEMGDREKAVMTFMTAGLKMLPQQVEMARSLPSWRARLEAVRVVPRELEAVERYNFNPERFIGLKVPTLLFVGGESPPPMKEATKIVHEALSQSRIMVMPGEGHAAGGLPGPGAEFMAKKIIDFLEEA
jgi:pimeloyl-ACP methyl ester carboxylesterase